MIKIVASLLTFLLFYGNVSGQTDISSRINNGLSQLTKSALIKIKSGEESAKPVSQPFSNFQTGVTNITRQIRLYKNYVPTFTDKHENKRGYDTFWVFNDTTITGTWTHNGPIFIINNGILRFKNVNATVYGDILLWGTQPKMYVTNSTLYFPQAFFYQRTWAILTNAYVNVTNSTLNFSGLSHSVAVAQNSVLEMNHVTNIGFTTNGIYSNGCIKINGSNQAGEFVITDSCQLVFRNAHTILLWHQFPDKSKIDLSFPSKSDTVVHYRFDKNTAGVSGVKYQILADTCTDVMWALMPASGSDVTIRNSKVRAIGMWFEKPDSLVVSGLVDNSHYTDFVTSLSDRNLHLLNCDVMTWNLYPMKNSNLNITGCIVGEIGLEQKARVQGTNFTVDGSGGYFWGTDTSVTFAGFCTSFNDVRSDQNAIFVFAYSSLVNGVASALKNSVLLCIQSSLQEDPVAYDNGVVWNIKIDRPSKGYTESSLPVFGSAWIDHAGKNPLMIWNHYEMYYQENTEKNWHKIPVDSTQKVRNDTLCFWNTAGLPPDLYSLKLIVSDNNGFKVEAVKGINLLQGQTPVYQSSELIVSFTAFPVPASDLVNVGFTLKTKMRLMLMLEDETGKIIIKETVKNYSEGQHFLNLNLKGISPGNYFIKICNDDYSIQKTLKIKII